MPTTIKLKNSVTTTNAPSSLAQGEVAINITDKKVWVGNAATTPIQLLGAGGSATFGALTCTSLTNSGLTSGRVTYAGASGVLQDDADFTFNGTTVTMANDASISGLTVGKGGGSQANNTAIGYQAMNGSNGNNGQVAVGYQALFTNTTGYGTAVGWRSLYLNTTGASNTAIGNTASYSNTTGAANVSVGEAALYSNTTASNNTAVGYQAGYSNTTGTQQVFVGYQAGQNTTTGGLNTFVGTQAGITNVTGTQNTFIGRAAGQNTTSSFNTFVGDGSGYLVSSGSRNTVLGLYNGNQGGLDIRTASNYAVISDGDGNPLISTSQGRSVALEGAVPQTGEGITFPATQVASSNANTLDDYEEGTWTPTINPATGTVTAQTGSGTYTKIGRQVTVAFSCSVTSGTIATISTIGGLPFTPSSTGCGAAREYIGTGFMWELEVISGLAALSPHRYDNSHIFLSGYGYLATCTYFV